MADNQIPEKLSKKLDRVKELANYCFSCGKCQIVCPTSQLGIFSPKTFIHKYVTEGYEDLDKFITEEKLFNCLTCEQCAIYCPMATEDEGVIFAEIIQGLREYGYNQGLLKDELSLGRTHDGIMQLYPKIQSDSELKTNKMDFIKDDPALKTKEEGDLAYFIGCASLLEDVFFEYNIKHRDVPRAVVTLLNEAGIEPVVLETKCCGHDNYWVGDAETAKKLAQYNVDLYHKAGVKTIIVECAEGYRMWKYDYPDLVENCDFEVKHFSEYVIENKVLESLEQVFPVEAKVTFHDPCRMGRLGGHLYEPAREILKNLPGIELVELQHIKDDANCCGVSTFRSCNSDTKRIRENRINEAIETGASYLITTCPKCITHFSCFLSEVDDDGNERPEKSQIKIMDLATFIAKVLQRI